MSALIRPQTAKVTITVELPDGATVSASADMDTQGWTSRAAREYLMVQQTKRVLVGLCTKWDTLRRSVR